MSGLVFVEECLVGASGEDKCADVLVLSATVAGIVDGATAKPWDDPSGPNGRTIAEVVSACLSSLGPTDTCGDAVDQTTSDVAELLGRSGISPGKGSAAAFAVVHLGRREVWRVGEAHVLVGGQPVPEKPAAEQIVARARALVLREMLLRGVTIDDLRRDDPGRRAVEPMLRALVGMRNKGLPGYRNVAIDGQTVPSGLVDVIPLPEAACEVVITSDGYPEAAPNLAEAESLLARRLARDPLLIAHPPATKGWMSGQVSFDDRCYVRLLLPAGRGTD